MGKVLDVARNRVRAVSYTHLFDPFAGPGGQPGHRTAALHLRLRPAQAIGPVERNVVDVVAVGMEDRVGRPLQRPVVGAADFTRLQPLPEALLHLPPVDILQVEILSLIHI